MLSPRFQSLARTNGVMSMLLTGWTSGDRHCLQVCNLVRADLLLHPLFDDASLDLFYLASQCEPLESHGSCFCLGLRVALE